MGRRTQNYSRSGRHTATRGSDGLLSDARELWGLVVAYVRQETVDPIKGLGRFVGYGLAGSLAVGVGGILLVVALLRLLQTGSALDGNLSAIPYLITFVVAGLAAAVAVMVGTRDGRDT